MARKEDRARPLPRVTHDDDRQVKLSVWLRIIGLIAGIARTLVELGPSD